MANWFKLQLCRIAAFILVVPMTCGFLIGFVTGPFWIGLLAGLSYTDELARDLRDKYDDLAERK